MLNIDVSATAFYTSMPMIDFLVEVLDLRSRSDLYTIRQLNDAQRIKFMKEISGKKIEVTHAGSHKRKYRVFGVTRLSATNQTFPLQVDDNNTIECTVLKYFQNRHGRDLQFPHLPCLQVGQASKHTFLPLEVCNIVPGQRCIKKLTDTQTSKMIKTTARSAPDRQSEIANLVKRAGFNKDPYVREFGMSVVDQMSEVSGRILPAPVILYGGGTSQVEPKRGRWDMRQRQFYQGMSINVYAIACFCPSQKCTDHNLRNFAKLLHRIGEDAGMPFRSGPVFCQYVSGADQVEPMFKHLVSRFKTLQLLLVVLPGKTPVYAEVKRVGDTVLGIATQCVRMANVNTPSAQTLSNLCLKINSKLGGINSILLPQIRPAVFNEPIIFFGADITHPSVGDTRRPSIAAVVGSVDAHPSRYSTRIRLQHDRGDMILELASMVQELLVDFYKATRFKPIRIIMYRDGLSESQFEPTMQYELRAIRKACITLEEDYQPKITFIAVQKRHHTRLFCRNVDDRNGKSGNIPAGTTVDSDICHPTQYDFYLCSHAGIQGTSRPTRYTVLSDDNDFKADDIQMLTYQLCHTYVRCTRSVSIPAPTYYAHLVAFRARYHLADKEMDMSGEGSMISSITDYAAEYSSQLKVLSKSIEIQPGISKNMYFA